MRFACIREALAALIGAVTFAIGTTAHAAGPPPIAGDYQCVSDCRPSDAPPNIEVDGSVARCRSELGGLYTGRLLTERSVACFGKTGMLSDDGTMLLWSNGGVWKRR